MQTGMANSAASTTSSANTSKSGIFPLPTPPRISAVIPAWSKPAAACSPAPAGKKTPPRTKSSSNPAPLPPPDPSIFGEGSCGTAILGCALGVSHFLFFLDLSSRPESRAFAARIGGAWQPIIRTTPRRDHPAPLEPCYLLAAICYLSFFTLPAPSPPTHPSHPATPAPARSRESLRRPRSPRQFAIFHPPSRSAHDPWHRGHPPVPRSDTSPVPWLFPATPEETASPAPWCDSTVPSGRNAIRGDRKST